MSRDLRGPVGQARTALRKEAPSTGSIIRDAKGLALELKAMLKRKDPWDREVEFQREALRKAYLQIIISTTPSSASTSSVYPAHVSASSAHPLKPTTSTSSTASSSHAAARLLGALNLLWLETSHALIHIYRAKVAEMERTIAEAPQAHRNPRGRNGGNNNNGGMPAPGPTARRRLIHSFRTFLGQEEEFFRVLLGRLAASLYPADLAGLRSLGVVVDRDEGEEQFEAQRTDEERKARRNRAVPLAHKALICFGDLARYRELYNEPGGGPAATGKKDGGGKRGGKGKAEGGERKPKNWARAAECYHQARLLLPDNGNPSNQLAVLSQYVADPLSSTYHYYRALSVRSPFPTARTNLEITYAKAVARWFSGDGGEPDGDDGVKFRAAFVALQGLYFVKARISDIPALSERVQTLFKSAVEDRLLTSDAIVKTVVTGLCALWNARVFRSAGKKSSKSSSRPSPPPPNVNLEPHILIHVLSLYRILLSIGSSETNELLAFNAASPAPVPLAQNISAVLRRTLPALRILTKWIMGQLEYIARVEARVEAKERKVVEDESPRETQDAQLVETHADESLEIAGVGSRELEVELKGFWNAYADFGNSIKWAFPLEELPSAREGGVWFEEDVDLLGFAPLRRGMKEGVGAADGMPMEIARVGRDVHPNEEQLMRIAELQADALLVADSEASLVVVEDGAFVFSPCVEEPSPESLEAREVALAAERIATAFNVPSSFQHVDEPALMEEDDADEFAEEATEDDPVDLAMRIGTADRMQMDDVDDEDDEDDENIVYQSLSSSQLIQSLFLPPLTATGPRTANDLLHQVLSGAPVAASPPPSFVQTSLLHHQGSPPVGRSIWAPTEGSASASPNPVSRGSFESLPNLTHQAVSAGASPSSSLWARPSPLDNTTGSNSALPTSRHPSFSSGSIVNPSPLGQQLPSSPPRAPLSLFGNFSPFASSSPPLPVSTPSGANNVFAPPNSDLSPSAFPFVSRSPQRPAYPGAGSGSGAASSFNNAPFRQNGGFG